MSSIGDAIKQAISRGDYEISLRISSLKKYDPELYKAYMLQVEQFDVMVETPQDDKPNVIGTGPPSVVFFDIKGNFVAAAPDGIEEARGMGDWIGKLVRPDILPVRVRKDMDTFPITDADQSMFERG